MRVSVVGFVVLSLCCCSLSVNQHLTSGVSNHAVNGCTYSMAYKIQILRGDLSEITAFKSYGRKHKPQSYYANILP